MVCLGIAHIPVFDQGSSSVGLSQCDSGTSYSCSEQRTTYECGWGAGLSLKTVIWLKGDNRATSCDVGSHFHFRDDLQVKCYKVYIVTGLVSARQLLLDEFFDFKLASIFVSLLELTTKVSWMNTFNASLMPLQY